MSETENTSFRVGRPGLKKLLGDLEADIMQAVWEGERDDVTVRDVHERVARHRKVAYTTIMTVMGNLATKGVLRVEREGKAHVYRPAQTYEAFTESAVSRIVDDLMKDFADPALACFSRALQHRDAR